MDEERRRVPTWSRVWQYPWLIRGIPGYRPFWRPINGWTFVVGGVAFIVTLILRRLGLHPTEIAPTVWFHFGVPVIVGYAVSKAQLNGKRLDRWVIDQIMHAVEPKQLDRFREVEGGATYSFSDGGEQTDAQGAAANGPPATAGRVRDRQPDHHAQA